MKKTIAILLVLVLAGVGLFAAPTNNSTDTLTLTTKVATQFSIKLLSTASLSSMTPGQFNDATTLGTYAFNDTTYDNFADYSIAIKTNGKTGIIVGATASSLASTETVTKISYTISNGTETLTSTTVAGGTPTTLFTEGTVTSGMRILSQPITISLTQTGTDSVANAAASDLYTGTVTFTLTTY